MRAFVMTYLMCYGALEIVCVLSLLLSTDMFLLYLFMSKLNGWMDGCTVLELWCHDAGGLCGAIAECR